MGLVVVLVSCASSGNPTPPSPGTTTALTGPVVVHTDVDLDDAMAIMMMLRADVNVIAIAVAGNGVARPKYGVPNAQGLVALAEAEDIPISYGADRSLLPSGEFPKAWRDLSTDLGGVSIPDATKPPDSRSAAALISDSISGSNEPVTVVGLAPATDLAIALRDDPEIVDNINAIFLTQSGRVNSPDAPKLPVSQLINWNTYIDALATAIIVESGANVTFVSSNADRSDPIKKMPIRELQQVGNPYAEFVANEATALRNAGRAFFWDPTTTAVAMQPSVCTDIVRKPTRVVLRGGNRFGLRVVEPGWREVDICLEADFEQFQKVMLDSLSE